MIKSEPAYQKAVEKLKDDENYIAQERKRFQEMNLSPENVEIAIQSLVSFHEQLKSEVEYYEKIKRGTFNPIHKFTDIGRTLIAFRIYKNISQKELAERLGVSAAQISRDERHEYYGATTEKIENVMQAMGMRVNIVIDEIIGA